jgi:hypothetical protein
MDFHVSEAEFAAFAPLLKGKKVFAFTLPPTQRQGFALQKTFSCTQTQKNFTFR